MKKLLIILLVSGAFVACNNASENTEETIDSPEVPSVTLDSSTVAAPDTIAIDSTSHVH